MLNPLLALRPPSNKITEYIHEAKQHPFAIRVLHNSVLRGQLSDNLKISSSEEKFKKYIGKKVKVLTCVKKNPTFNVGYCSKALKKLIYLRYAQGSII